MTDGIDQALQAAGIALLTADTGLTVYDGKVPPGAGRGPYVAVYTVVDWPKDTDSGALSLDGTSSACTVSWYCHCVGGDDVAAIAVAARVKTQLLDQVPVVAGVVCNMIRLAQPSTQPQRDESTGVQVMDALRVFEMYVSK